MNIYFKLKSFPQVSETFIVDNLIYVKKKGFKIKVFVNRFMGLENSSQTELLRNYNLKDDLVKPYTFNTRKTKKAVQVIMMLMNFRILRYLFLYYKLKRKKNLSPLATLYQYRNFKSGLFHVHFNNSLNPLIELSKIGYVKPKCIITFHGYDAFIENKETFEKKYGEFYRRYVTNITTNSNYLKKEIVKLGISASMIQVIPVGIDFEKFKGQPKQLTANNSIELITVGRLIQLKGQIYGIRAIAELKNMGIKVNYTIVGNGDYETILVNEVKKLNLANCVRFIGSKSQNEIISLLNSSDLFLMTSTYDDTSSRREAFGLVSIEAQAMGLPVIGFDSGGFPETLVNGKTGFVVEDRNHNALAKKIKVLIDNPQTYKAMSYSAIKHAEKFDFKSTTQQYLDLYKESIQN